MGGPENYFAAAVAVLLAIMFFYLIGKGLIVACGGSV